MIRHIVMFQLIHNSEKEINIRILKDKLDALKNKISQIIHLETGVNMISSQRNFDLVLISEFNNVDDLEIYRAHPEHVLILDFLKKVNEKIVVVDYNPESIV